MKRQFKFSMPDGSIESSLKTEYLISKGLSTEQITLRQKQRDAHLKSEVIYERAWKNEELKRTDCLLPVDATYNKQAVHQCHYYDDIMNYRRSLREYDLKSMDRPERPVWFKG